MKACNILYGEIDWYEQYDNDPEFKFLLNYIPQDELIYTEYKVNHCSLYLGLWDGFVNYFFHNPWNERGYGGRIFSLPVWVDPYQHTFIQKEIRGPWSGNPQTVREMTGYNCMEARVTTDLSTFRRGYTFTRASFLTKKIEDYMSVNMLHTTLENNIPKKLASAWVYNLPQIDFHLAFAYYKNEDAEDNHWIAKYFDKMYSADWREVFKKNYA